MTQDEDFKTLFNYIDFFLADLLLRTLEYKMTKSKLSIHCRSRFQKEESISNLQIFGVNTGNYIS